jgi:predicted GNAT family N-acyltransferase
MKKIEPPICTSDVVTDQPTAPMPLDPPGAHRGPRAAAGPDAAFASRLTLHRVAGPAEPVFQELCQLVCDDPQYWAQTRVAPVNERVAHELLGNLAAGAAPEQKYLWALRLDGRLVGCLDALREWPTRNTLSIGLLMFAPPWRGQRLGHAALAQLRARTRAWSGVRRWRVAVVESQARARQFWRSMAFVETGQRENGQGHRAPLVVMERNVPGG